MITKLINYFFSNTRDDFLKFIHDLENLQGSVELRRKFKQAILIGIKNRNGFKTIIFQRRFNNSIPVFYILNDLYLKNVKLINRFKK